MSEPSTSYGEVRVTQLRSNGSWIAAALVGEDLEHWLGYPGDVCYPKADWVRVGVVERLTLDAYRQRYEAEWDKVARAHGWR